MATALVSGAGSIGRRHLRNLQALGIRNLGVYDPHQIQDAETPDSLGARIFRNFDQALHELKPDAVFVCSPPVYHASQALTALRSSAHVFIEKPLSHNLDGLDELIAEAKLRNSVAQVGYNLRFHPGLQKVKQLLEEGAIGRVLWVHAEAGQYLPDWRPHQDYTNAYTARRELGGGILLDGSHELDYIQWMLGLPTAVFCMAGKLSNLKVDVEDCASLLLRFPGGAQAEVHLDFVQHGYTRSLKVVGDRGTILWDFNVNALKIFRGDRKQWEETRFDFDLNDMYLSEVAHFLDCITTGKTPMPNLQEAKAVLETVLRAKASAAETYKHVEAGIGPSHIVAIIQARMGSSRLPGKTMAEVNGRPMLWHVVERVKRSSAITATLVATTDRQEDDVIAEFCQENAIACYRGSTNDVLDRYYRAAKSLGATVIVRITGDCPFVDPGIVDAVVNQFNNSKSDYSTNTLVRTFPDGLDIEVFSIDALERAWREATKPSEREHVTLYMRSSKFVMSSVENREAYTEHRHRWTVDEPADLEFVRRVYAEFAATQKTDFRMNDILALLKAKPDLEGINAKIVSNEGYYRSIFQEAVASAAPALKLASSHSWFDRSRAVIPGAAQTFSKGINQHVRGVAPIFLDRGDGCRVWDVDGNEYIDYIQGLLPNILGYNHPEVNAAVMHQLAQGHSFSLPNPLEVVLAERLTRLIPCAEMARFGKNGSDATSGAVRAARAFTGRDHIACCGYHGWQDWYIGSTTRNAGVPTAVRGLTHTFPYNDLEALDRLLSEHKQQFAAVIMEPVNFTEPAPGYLLGVKQLAHRHGALLIFDEICSGFHFGLGGAQKHYGVAPDLACFGKAMGNGFPISCVVGRSDVMKTFEEIFFSFTFGGEVASIAAALTVLDILEQTDVLLRMEANGRLLQDGFNLLAKYAGLSEKLVCVGHPRWSLIKFKDAQNSAGMLLRSLIAQELAKRGVLALVTHNMTGAHDHIAIRETLAVYAAVFKTVAAWLKDGTPEKFLEGEMIQPVFSPR